MVRMTSKEFDRRFSGITPKPRHVILQLLQGKKDDEISLEMESAVTTIRKHIENLCDLFEIPGEIDGIKRRRRDLLTALFLEHRPDLVNAEVSIGFPKTSVLSIPERERESWQERIDVANFIGREKELKDLNEWVLTEKCRLVGIHALPGMGKTFLGTKFSTKYGREFDRVIWRSLNGDSCFADLVKDWLEWIEPEALDSEMNELINKLKGKYEEIKKVFRKVTDEQKLNYQNLVNQTLDRLLVVLRDARCLLILDNFDQVLLKGDFAGDYELHHKPYGLLLKRLASELHTSCLLVLSREKPREILTADTLPTRTLDLSGFTEENALEFLGAKETTENELVGWRDLIRVYGYNPLALKFLKPIINDLWGGNINNFINQSSLTEMIQNFSNLIQRQLEILTSVERHLLYYLATQGKQSLSDLSQASIPDDLIETDTVISAMLSLKSRFLIEKLQNGYFSLQPVIQECTLKSLGQVFVKEIQEDSDYLLLSHFDISKLTDRQIRLILREFLKENSHLYWLDFFKELEQSHGKNLLLQKNLKMIKANLEKVLFNQI